MEQLSEFVVNHWMLVTAFCAVAGLLLANLLSGAGGVSPLEAVNLINRENAQVIDVRSAEDFARGHLAGAINVPLKELDGATERLQRFKGRPLLVCCQSGTSAMGTARRLRTQGFADVRVLAGGVQAWRSANLPLTSD
ncbi:MAG: rhodanese-like domain-containing protein [Gammaproteobacteria bacterium]